jgi:hypothetical protein
MASLRKSPLLVIDNVQAFTAGQKQVIGPFPGGYELVNVTFHGNTAAKPIVKVGSYVGTTFTSAATLVNGLDGSAAALGATRTALAVGIDCALVANGPIAEGQYFEIEANTNTVARYTFKLVSNSSAANFATETTPA